MDDSSTAERLILRFDSASFSAANGHVLFDGSHPAQAERYLRAVEELRRHGSSSSNGRILKIAISKLEEEFRNILVSRVPDIDVDLLLSDLSSLSMVGSVDDGGGSSSRRQGSQSFEEEEGEEEEVEETRTSSFRLGSLGHRSTSSLMEIDLVPSDVLYDLRGIAEQMISCGYGNECIQAYGSVRKEAIEFCLQQLNVEKLSVEEIRSLPWNVQEVKVRRWIRFAGLCVRVVFASERRLCDLIFDGLDDVFAWSDIAFTESVKPAAFWLLAYAEAISLGERAPERLFAMVDVHDALRELIPDVESVFFGPSESILQQSKEILSQLVEAVEGTFYELETAIRSNYSKEVTPGGRIHPITRYVMNYIRYISDYKVSLSELIVSKPSGGDHMEFTVDEGQSPLSFHLLYMMASLTCNLEDKAKLYNNDALSHLFLVNNLHYIVQKVKDSSELRELVGDGYPKRLTKKYLVAATMYKREAWGKIIEGIQGSRSLTKSELRERLKSFNAAFEESHRTQSTWVVPDGQLREELRIMISAGLLPAYQSFLGRYKHHIESERHPELYVKYTVEGLEKAIGGFFEGPPPPQPPKRRSSSLRLLSYLS